MIGATLRRALPAVAGLAAALLVSACGGEAPAASPQAPSASGAAQTPVAGAYPSSVDVGISLPFSGFDAADGGEIRNGVLLAMSQLNARGGIGGKIRLDHWIRDEGSIASDGDDPDQAALNMTQFLADTTMLGMIGGYSSDAVKTMLDAQVKSANPMPFISASASAPEMTDPAHASGFRPKGKPFFFRTVTTDRYQGPGMANFAAAQGLKTAYVLNEQGSISGRSAADLFTQRAQARGIRVLGRAELDPALLDYTGQLAEVLAANPQGIYYDGGPVPWLKLVKQGLNQALPRLLMAGDGIYAPPVPARAGVSGEGWYLTVPLRYSVDQPRAASWRAAYTAMFHAEPVSAYSLSGYLAMEALADAMNRIVKDGAPLTRDNVQAYLLQTKLATIQGPITFDENGDLTDHSVSIVQIADSGYHYKDLAPAQ